MVKLKGGRHVQQDTGTIVHHNNKTKIGRITNDHRVTPKLNLKGLLFTVVCRKGHELTVDTKKRKSF